MSSSYRIRSPFRLLVSFYKTKEGSTFTARDHSNTASRHPKYRQRARLFAAARVWRAEARTWENTVLNWVWPRLMRKHIAVWQTLIMRGFSLTSLASAICPRLASLRSAGAVYITVPLSLIMAWLIYLERSNMPLETVATN